MNKIIECVPNFSEGRDQKIIESIANSIKQVAGVKLLNVDPGKATNRTVMTFVGSPTSVIEAAFQAIKMASQLIDMSKHTGEHPRMGATDVCPLIPIKNVTMDECVEFANQLAKRVSEDLNIPTFLYESAAKSEVRRNLANIREGEYEGLSKKLMLPEWKPDYGNAEFNPKSGATVIGARDFLVAYNINLNTTSTRIANAIAFDVREQGRIKRIGHPLLGEIVLDEQGNEVRIPGTLKSVKAIGWFIEEYGQAQISMNLTNIGVTPVHIAFDEVCNKANERGVRVTGSEIVGMIPKSVLIDAGKHYLTKQGRSKGISEKEIIDIAIKSLGLNEISPFKPEERVIEFMLEEDNSSKKLTKLSLLDFANLTNSEAPAPGGGSISAYVGGLGAALCGMVANLSASKRGWEDKLTYFSEVAEKSIELMEKLLFLVDEDTKSFNAIMNAFGLPKATEIEKSERSIAIQNATVYATRIPLEVMETANQLFPLVLEMAKNGNQNSISDAGVGGICLNAAIEGAFLNVKINAASLKNHEIKESLIAEANQISQNAKECLNDLLQIVNQAIKI